jgi:uncharacterized protein YndB with AHSA1/START domain
MSVKKDASGQRSVEAEAEVPGTPEEVWKAIATGEGVSSWFVPTVIDGKEGGTVTASFGPGMDSVAKITSWNPPHGFIGHSDDMGPGAPPVATEWIVEARSGGKCIVRVVHRWFSDKDDWDHQYEGTVHGWNAFFRILRLYLTHFRGMRSAAFQLMGFAPEPQTDVWTSLMASLGFDSAVVGQQVKAAPKMPPLAGVVERVGEIAYPELLLRLQEPAPGVAHLFAMPMGGHVCLSIRCFFYGDRAAAVVARDEPAWQSWMNENFPAPTGSETMG